MLQASMDFHSSLWQFSYMFFKSMEVSTGEADTAHPFDLIGKQILCFLSDSIVRKIYPTFLWDVITWKEATTDLFLYVDIMSHTNHINESLLISCF